MSKLPKLPLGSQSFETLRAFDEAYVDKTRMIGGLARARARLFLARPRRFGKSLLVSTFASLFEHGLRDFQGLEIEKHWSDKTYDVVKFDFSNLANFRTAAEFASGLRKKLKLAFEPLGLVLSADEERFEKELAAGLAKLERSSVVLLIDEYDAPLIFATADDALFSGVEEALKRFFDILKVNEGAFRFCFVTGVTRYGCARIFNAFDPTDISFEPEYGTLLGYTEDELLRNFGDHLKKASASLGVSMEMLLKDMRKCYAGFSFDRECRTHVYCPWSVLNFLQSETHAFENHWFSSAGLPDILMRHLSAKKPEAFLKPVRISAGRLFSSAPGPNLNALLQQTGCLTIRSVDEAGNLELGYPNREVESSMAQLYSCAMVHDEDFMADDVLNALCEGNAAAVVHGFNQILSVLDYTHFPVGDEAGFKGVLQIVMLGFSIRSPVEVRSGSERDNLEVEAGPFRWVFECKFARAGADAKALSSEAVEQIRKRDYGNTPHGKALIRVGMVFNEEKRRITDWRTAVDAS